RLGWFAIFSAPDKSVLGGPPYTSPVAERTRRSSILLVSNNNLFVRELSQLTSHGNTSSGDAHLFVSFSDVVLGAIDEILRTVFLIIYKVNLWTIFWIIYWKLRSLFVMFPEICKHAIIWGEDQEYLLERRLQIVLIQKSRRSRRAGSATNVRPIR